MSPGRVPLKVLNVLIAVEVSGLLLLLTLLPSLLLSLREVAGPAAAGPAAKAPLPPPGAAVRAHTVPAPPPAAPVTHLPSRRFMRGLAAVPPGTGASVPCFPATVKIEPARGTRWKSSRERSGEGPIRDGETQGRLPI